MVIQTVIIEDEENSVRVINDLLQHYAPEFEMAGVAGTVEKSVHLIESKAPQLVFLDVQIADGTGFDVLKKLSPCNFELIFTTAYNNYAVEAFRHSAIDYLLKPLSIEEFEQAIEKVKRKIQEKNNHLDIDRLLSYIGRQQDNETRISIATINGFEFRDFSDIIWCSSEGAYTVFYFADKTKLISSRNLGSYENILCSHNFCRIHHSSVINIRFIKSYIKGKGGYVVMKDGTELEISQRRKADFLKKYGPL
jgi:two-component system LytT family response regulator